MKGDEAVVNGPPSGGLHGDRAVLHLPQRGGLIRQRGRRHLRAHLRVLPVDQERQHGVNDVGLPHGEQEEQTRLAGPTVSCFFPSFSGGGFVGVWLRSV